MAQSKCKHEHTMVTTTGGMYLSQGEATDNIEEHEYCLDCGKEIKRRKSIKSNITNKDIAF